jgi:hypothetical protein
MKFRLNVDSSITKFVCGYPFVGGKVYDTDNMLHRMDVDMTKVTPEALKTAAKKVKELEVLPDTYKLSKEDRESDE